MNMSSRVQEIRKKLRAKLQELKTPGSWDHITCQTGLFSYVGLSTPQVEYLMSKYDIYLLKSGRINICGINDDNLDYVASALHDAITNYPQTNKICDKEDY